MQTTMKQLTAREKISEAIEAVYAHAAQFADIVGSWRIVSDDKVTQTMATDGPTLFYCDAFVDKMTIAETEWVLHHEAAHVWLGHHVRLTQSSDAQQKNVAFDLAVHEVIPDPPRDSFLNAFICKAGARTFAHLPVGKDAEWYFDTLSSKQQQEQQQSDEEQQQQESDEQQSGSGESDSAEGEQSPEAQDAQGSAESAEASEQSSEGAGAAESEAESDSEGEASGSSSSKGSQQSSSQSAESALTEGQLGEVLPNPKCATPEGAVEAEGEWQQVVARSINTARMCGTSPGWFIDKAESLLGKSKTDWRTVLRRFLTKSVPQGASFRKANRRSVWRNDCILPGKFSKGSGDGLIIVDTSGSIFSTVKETVVPEIERILSTLPRSKVHVMQIDTRITSEKKFSSYDFPIDLEVSGGGGTELAPAFIAAQEMRGQYRWCICITDLYWNFPATPNPGIPVFWVVIGDHKGQVPFGERVSVKKQ